MANTKKENEVAILYQKQLEEFAIVETLLRDDVGKHLELLEKNLKDQTWRRSLVRAVFAYIEGMSARVKESSLLISASMGIELDDDAVDSIRAMYQFTGPLPNGRKSRRPGFLDDIKSTFKLGAKASRSGFVLDTSGRGWQDFRKAVHIRHRITHPKSIKDLLVTDAEFNEVAGGYAWFKKSLDEVFMRRDTDDKSNT